MGGSQFDEAAFFAAIRDSGARALVIGRRALVFLGLPVMTADYDFWLHIDDMELFNAAVVPFDLHPSRTPDEARARGRYVLSNDEHVDVLIARTVPTVDGVTVAMEDVWSRRQMIRYAEGIDVAIPRTPEEIEETRELVNWFRSRYPTPAGRSAYIRQAMRRWLGETDRTRS